MFKIGHATSVNCHWDCKMLMSKNLLFKMNEICFYDIYDLEWNPFVGFMVPDGTRTVLSCNLVCYVLPMSLP